MKEFHPEQLKKWTGTLPKVDLNVDNFELWMTVMSAVEQMEQVRSWILTRGHWGFHPPWKTKKNFFDSCIKKCPFSKLCMLINSKNIYEHIWFDMTNLHFTIQFDYLSPWAQTCSHKNLFVIFITNYCRISSFIDVKM